MFRDSRCGLALTLVLLAGCTKNEDYLKVFRDHRAALKEMADVLESVKDEKTMAEAKIVLDEKNQKFEAISRRASSLPKPLPPEVQKRMEEDIFVTQRTMDRLKEEVGRVRRLPGGTDFIKQFESKSPGLMSAVQP